MKGIRLGAGAGFGGDRFDPALELVERGDLDYLVFECLAERTIALYQQERMQDPKKGYNPQLTRRLRPVLTLCRQKGVPIISNMGGANPLGAMEKVLEMGQTLGLKGLKVAAVQGDDVFTVVEQVSGAILEQPGQVADYQDRMISANAYLGCAPIVEALEKGADVILTGRVADPALFLAPLVFRFGWSLKNYSCLGAGTLVGHLLECAGQVSGGYFADPDQKEVPNLSTLGFPLAEVEADGSAIITKPAGSGGMITPATCKEQLLYEIHDPKAYLTPDCTADFTGVQFTQVQADQVRVEGAQAGPPPAELKVSIGYRDSFIGEGEIHYGGTGAVQRAQLAAEIVKKRLQMLALPVSELRFDLLGVDGLYGPWITGKGYLPAEVALRVAGRCRDKESAQRIGEEVEALWTNGPAGGGGARKSLREVIGIVSTMIPRNLVKTQVILAQV